MIDFMKRNLHFIYVATGFVVICLLIPSVINSLDAINELNGKKDAFAMLGLDFNEVIFEEYIRLIKFVCYVAVGILFIVQGYKRSFILSLIYASAIVYFAADCAVSGYNFINNNDFASLYTIIINICIISFYIIACKNKRYFFGALIVLLVDLAFAVSSAFSGSEVGLSEVLLSSLMIAQLYFFNNYRNYQSESVYYS